MTIILTAFNGLLKSDPIEVAGKPPSHYQCRVGSPLRRHDPSDPFVPSLRTARFTQYRWDTTPDGKRVMLYQLETESL